MDKDIVSVMSGISGISKTDTRQILDRVIENNKKLDSCSKHDFKPIGQKKIVGNRYKCTNCEGEVDSINASWYNKGLEHGGNK